MRKIGQGFGARAVAVAALLAVLIPGGAAVGFHSGTNKHPFRTIVAPYSGSDHFSYASCGPLGLGVTTSCGSDASADATTGEMSASASVSPVVPLISGGSAGAYSVIRATDSIRRTVSRRGYTVTLHVDRLDIQDAGGYSFASLSVYAYQAACECSRQMGVYLDPGKAGQDVEVFLDFGPLGPGDVTLTTELYVDTYLPLLSTNGPASIDVAVTLEKIEVFR